MIQDTSASVSRPDFTPNYRSGVFCVAILLFFIVFALFAPSIHYGFVALDDQAYVTQNNLVLPGLTLHTLKGAFATRPYDAAIYVPLLWISFMSDVTLFGASPDNPAPFHATNIALHSANAVLFFLVLLRLLGISLVSALHEGIALQRPEGGTALSPSSSFFRSLCISSFAPPFLLTLLWAVHPLRVESVAWVTERKDTLSLFFALLALLAYLRTASPGGRFSPPDQTKSRGHVWGATAFFYAGSILLLAAALLVKPTLVPFPILLVAIDNLVFRRPFSIRCLLSKAPFFILAVAAALSTLDGHSQTVFQLPIVLRLAHLPQNFIHYLFLFLFPCHLTPLDSRPDYAWFPSILALLLLGGLLLLALRLRQRAPFSSLGIFWFFLFLIPVSGLSTIPNATVADRFSYIPALGLSLALLPVFRFSRAPFPLASPPNGTSSPRRNSILLVVLIAATALSAAITTRILPYWRSSDAFFARVRVFSPVHPFVALHDAKTAIISSGDYQTASAAIQASLANNPNSPQLVGTMADCIANIDGPLPALRFLAPFRPSKGPIFSTWSWQMAQLSLWSRRYADAITFADLAQKSLPSMDTLHGNIQRLRTAAAAPDSADALPHYISQWMTYERTEALDFFRRFIAANPDRPDILANIAWILATADWSPAPPSEAIDYANRAMLLAPDPPPPELLDTYAAALANASDFPSAIEVQERAISLLPPSSSSHRAYHDRLDLYRQSRPYRHDIGIY